MDLLQKLEQQSASLLHDLTQDQNSTLITVQSLQQQLTQATHRINELNQSQSQFHQLKSQHTEMIARHLKLQQQFEQQQAQLQMVFEPLPVPQARHCDYTKAELQTLQQLLELKGQQCQIVQSNYEMALEQANEAKQAEIQAVKGYEEVKATLGEKEQELGMMAQVVKQLQDQIQDLTSTRIPQLESQLCQAQSFLSDSKSESDSLKCLIQTHSQTIESLTNQIGQLETQLRTQHPEPLLKFNKIIESKLIEFKEHSSNLMTKNDLQMSLASLQQDIIAKEETIKKQQSQLNKLKNQLAIVQDESQSQHQLLKQYRCKLSQEYSHSQLVQQQLLLLQHQQSIKIEDGQDVNQVVRKYFIQVCKDIEITRLNEQKQFDKLRVIKEKQCQLLKQTIQSLNKVHKQDDKFGKVIECLEQEIMVMKEAKHDYVEQLQRLVQTPVSDLQYEGIISNLRLEVMQLRGNEKNAQELCQQKQALIRQLLDQKTQLVQDVYQLRTSIVLKDQQLQSLQRETDRKRELAMIVPEQLFSGVYFKQDLVESEVEKLVVQLYNENKQLRLDAVTAPIKSVDELELPEEQDVAMEDVQFDQFEVKDYTKQVAMILDEVQVVQSVLGACQQREKMLEEVAKEQAQKMARQAEEVERLKEELGKVKGDETVRVVKEEARKVTVRGQEDDQVQAIRALQMEIERLSKQQGPLNQQLETNVLFRKMMKALFQAKAVVKYQ